MATFDDTLFNQNYKKKKYEKEKKKKNDWTFKVKIQVIKSAILLNFYKVARPQMFLILKYFMLHYTANLLLRLVTK